MATYNAIIDTQLDPDSPLTSNLAFQFRDNPLAIAQADSSVPDSLLPTVLLGTVSLASGTSVVLSGLSLAPYKFLKLSYSQVITVSTSSYFFVTGTTGGVVADGVRLSPVSSGTMFVFTGTAEIDLSTGIGSSVCSGGPTQDGYVNANTSNITNATTDLYFKAFTGFSGGSMNVYGCK